MTPQAPPLKSVAARLSASLLGASLGGVVAGGLEASWVSAGQGVSGVAGLLPLMGVLAPVSLGVGVAVGVAALLLHRESPSLAQLTASLETVEEGERAALGWRLLLSGPLFLVWLWGAAALSLSVLAADAGARAAGATMALVVCGSAAACVLAWWGGAYGLALRFGGPGRQLNVMLGVGVGVGVLGVFGFALIGETSGTGSPWALFGVLRREELDLRGPALLIPMGLGAYLAPALLSRLKPMVALGLSLLPLACLGQAAFIGFADADVRIGVERHSGLAKLPLKVLSGMSDRDGDGFSQWFGGGDCNEKDARINPGSDDVPENGIDEDCSGSDAKRVTLVRKKTKEDLSSEAKAKRLLAEPFNVVLVTIDTLRYDLGYMGYERNVSPNIDRLAQKATVFERAYALASYTAKSLPPLLIGKYPSETNRDFSHFNRFNTKDQFIQERLQQQGVATTSVQGYWYFFHKGYGFERGFDVIDSSAAPKHIQMEGDRSSNSDKLSDAAIVQLKALNAADRQFFLWVHYIDPHSEYAPHEGFDFGSSSRDRYDGEVAFVDHHLGRVLKAIEEGPKAERTAVVLTSDHGEAFGEHGMIRHGFEVWEELVRVPLIVYVPGAPASRISARRGAIDVVPTLLDLMGRQKPSGDGLDFVSGVSLMADVAGAKGHTPEERIVFVDMPRGPHNAERQAFIENDMKLIASNGAALGLYDLSQDPGEKQDLKKDVERLTPVLERYKAFRRELRTVNVRVP